MSVALVIFFLSLAGIPPTAGFIGKFYVFSAALQTAAKANQMMLYALAVIGVINGVISVVYYFNVVRQMFFVPARESAPLRIPGSLRLALALTLVMTLVIGLYPQPFVDLANQSVQMLVNL
jgi:NADH-quinone oxidoreductase subunit N